MAGAAARFRAAWSAATEKSPPRGAPGRVPGHGSARLGPARLPGAALPPAGPARSLGSRCSGCGSAPSAVRPLRAAGSWRCPSAQGQRQHTRPALGGPSKHPSQPTIGFKSALSLMEKLLTPPKNVATRKWEEIHRRIPLIPCHCQC